MPTTLVLEPRLTFAEVESRCVTAGWRLVDQARDPILPGEPEYAVFERDADRAVYTFNPVCLLRVLDCSGVAEAALPDLPAVGTPMVLRWLTADDERTVLRGILAAGQLGDPALLGGVAVHRSHPRAAIADAATRAADILETAEQGPDADAELTAQAEAFAAIEVLKRQLTPLLEGLAVTRDDRLVGTFRPEPQDYERVFEPAAVDTAREEYETLWKAALRLGPPASPSSRVECHVAPAGMLSYPNELSERFPGGYGTIASLLQPQRVWVAWKVVERGESAGTAYDGLVWVDDHWAWFPRPYRMLAALVR